LFLLLQRTAARGGFWQPITGGNHNGEALRETVTRELYEETQLQAPLRIIEDVHTFSFTAKNGTPLTEYVFGAEVAADAEVTLSDEHDELRWVTYDEALTLLTYESNKEAMTKLLARIT